MFHGEAWDMTTFHGLSFVVVNELYDICVTFLQVSLDPCLIVSVIYEINEGEHKNRFNALILSWVLTQV